MKTLIWLFVPFAAFQVALSAIYDFQPAASTEVSNYNFLSSRVKERVTIDSVKRALDAICPGYGVKLEGALEEVVKCGDSVDFESETACSFIKNHGRTCISPVTNIFEECLPETSKSIVGLATNISLAAVKHVCEITGEEIFELGNECVMFVNARSRRCMRRTFTSIEQYQRKNAYPSARDVCTEIRSLKPCFESHVHQACGHPTTRKAFTDLLDVWISVCDSYEPAEVNEVNDVEQFL